MIVQLANTYSPTKNYRVNSWFASPKLDGVRAVFIPGKGLFTRNNKPISGFVHMAEILDDICNVRGLSFIDGELVLKSSSFQASQSVILSAHHPDKSNVQFHVFAVGGNFSNTADMLAALPDSPEHNIFRVNSQLIPNTPHDIEQACNNFTAMGYEGVMLRDPSVHYSAGRSNHLLKHKPFKEADLMITAIHEGTGKLAGKLGSVTVEGVIDGHNVRADAGTGLTDDDREALFADNDLTGKIITIKYQSLTDKPNDEGYYSLRFPVIIGLKQDRDFDVPAVMPAQKFTGQSNATFKKNGFVEVVFQPTLPDDSATPEAFIAQMEEWKSKLKSCNNIQEGLKLFQNLKLTVLEIMLFGEYLRVNLKGCRAVKEEIARRIVEMVFTLRGAGINARNHEHTGSAGNQRESGSRESAFIGGLDSAGCVPHVKRNFTLRASQDTG